MVGNIFDIQRFSIGNGPGIRTTVFLKGCPLRCQWCHNPESFTPKRQLKVNGGLCRQCGACVAACRHGAHLLRAGKHIYDRGSCILCGACIEACCYGCISWVGQTMTPEELAATLAADRVYYEKSGGGVTFSGGEPMLQADFIEETIRLLPELSFYLDTCGECDSERLQGILKYMDGVLFDLKHMDAERHRALTGRDNQRILRNLEIAAASAARLVVRYPMIPEANDEDANIGAMCLRLRELGITRLDVSPYHDYGSKKYQDLSMQEHHFKKYTEAELEERLNFIRSFGITPNVI